MSRRNIAFLLTAVIGLLADQLTKAWVVANIEYRRGEIELIPGWLSLVHARNHGAAWGMLSDFEYRHVVFGVFTVVAVGFILDTLRRLPTRDVFMAGTLGLILSGALGNAVDRVRQQYVTDFIRAYTEHPSLAPWLVETFGSAEWPSFNVADSSLVVGVILFLLYFVVAEDPEERATEAPAEST